MLVSLLDIGLIRVSVRYVKARKKNGLLAYCRRIPDAVRPHYGGSHLA